MKTSFRLRGSLTSSELDSHLRRELRDLEFELLVEDSIHAPAVTTITLPQHVSSLNFGRALEEEGFLLSYNSEYLVERNWIQVCLMGDHLPRRH